MKKRPKHYKTKRRTHKITNHTFKIMLTVSTVAILAGATQALAETITHNQNQKRLAPQSFTAYNYPNPPEPPKAIGIQNLPQPTQPKQIIEMTRQEVENIVRNIAIQENFPYPDYFIRLIRCENLRYPEDYYDPKRTNTQGNHPHTSTDVGMVMINDFWHPEITREQSEDFTYSIKWAMKRISNGYRHEWTCDRLI